MLVGSGYPGLYGFEFVEVPVRPPYVPCLTSTVKVQYLVSAAALDCKMLVGAETKVRYLMTGVPEPHPIPMATATVKVRQLVTSAGIKTCSVDKTCCVGVV